MAVFITNQIQMMTAIQEPFFIGVQYGRIYYKSNPNYNCNPGSHSV
jgi:hypothetical protein